MRKAVYAIAASLLVCVSAIGQQVMYNYPPAVDFSKFKTYTWTTPDGRGSLGEPWESDMRAAINSEFARKGLVRAEPHNADLFIRYEAAIGRKTNHASFAMGYAPSAHPVGWYRSPGNTSLAESAETCVNELAIYISDSNGNLVWHGLASMSVASDPGEQRKILKKAIAKLFRHFPATSDR